MCLQMSCSLGALIVPVCGPDWANSYKAVWCVSSSCSLLAGCHNHRVVALVVEPVEMSRRKKGKGLLPVYFLFPVATYRVGDALRFF